MQSRPAAVAALAGTLFSLAAIAQQTVIVSRRSSGVQLSASSAQQPALRPDGNAIVWGTDASSTAGATIGGSPNVNLGSPLYRTPLVVSAAGVSPASGSSQLVSWFNQFTQPPQFGPEPLAMDFAGTSSRPVIASNGAIAFKNNGSHSAYAGTLLSGCAATSNTGSDIWIESDSNFITWGGIDYSPCGGFIGPFAADAPAISGNGNYVFVQTADDEPSISFSTGPYDTNNLLDIYRFERSTTTWARVSQGWTGSALAGSPIQANGPSRNPAATNDQTLVAFESDATNLISGDTNGVTDIYVTAPLRFVNMGIPVALAPFAERVSLTDDDASASGPSTNPSISGNGRYVAFLSTAANMVSPSAGTLAQVYVRDRTAGTTVLLSKNRDGAPSNASCSAPQMSRDGNWIVFSSTATNLIRTDSTFLRDVYLVERATGKLWLASQQFGRSLGGNANSSLPAVSNTLGDGSVLVAFTSQANDLISDDDNGSADTLARRIKPDARDDCGNASVVFTAVPAIGTTIDATPDGTTTLANANDSADVSIGYTAPSTGQIFATTCGSDFDTVLSAHTACPASPANQIALSDDNAYGACTALGQRTSFFTLNVTAGQVLNFRLAGFAGRVGNYTLLVKYTCGPSDIAGPGQALGPDGQLTADDIIVFLNRFFAGDQRSNIAGPGQNTVLIDDQFTADDIIVFLNRFFTGC